MKKSEDLYQKGLKVMRQHLGKNADKYVKKIEEIAPQFSEVNVAFAFGEIYGDGESPLDQKTRELVTVGALTVQGFALPQLKLHIVSALRCGASKEEILAVITQMIAYCGFPAATNAILLAKEVFEEIDALSID